MRHRNAIENFWRYLKMGVTPKFHLLFVHLLRFMEWVQGFGDLGEDSGEQARIRKRQGMRVEWARW